MKITPELTDKINNVAAKQYLSKGNYDDLVKACEDNNDSESVLVWQPFEDKSLEDVLEHVDDLANDILNLMLEEL